MCSSLGFLAVRGFIAQFVLSTVRVSKPGHDSKALVFFQDLFVIVLSWLPVACSRLSDGGMPMKNIDCGKI